MNPLMLLSPFHSAVIKAASFRVHGVLDESRQGLGAQVGNGLRRNTAATLDGADDRAPCWCRAAFGGGLVIFTPVALAGPPAQAGLIGLNDAAQQSTPPARRRRANPPLHRQGGLVRDVQVTGKPVAGRAFLGVHPQSILRTEFRLPFQ